MNIVTLGPAGTYCHQVAMSTYPEALIHFENSIDAVFSALLNEEISYAVVPRKNEISGNVIATMKNLAKYPFTVMGEVSLEITHHLAGFGILEEATSVVAHAHSFKQCEKTLKRLCPTFDFIEADSNAAAALMCREKKEKELMGIVTPLAAEIYGLPLLKKNIQDEKENITHFLVLGKP